MENAATFESAVLLIAAQEGCDRIEAMRRAKERNPLLYLEFAERVKAGGPDRTADLFDAVGLKSERAFEKIVADNFSRGMGKSESVLAAMKSDPGAYDRYLRRLRNGEHIRFDLNR
ncbi:MAG TPA: hypothetical protein PLO63_11710 [Syntrophales bacterium]|nr:hypothetical protein [Syntrophales bacterium]